MPGNEATRLFTVVETGGLTMLLNAGFSFDNEFIMVCLLLVLSRDSFEVCKFIYKMMIAKLKWLLPALFKFNQGCIAM